MVYNKLPQGWVECELKDIFDIVTGKTPSKKHPEYFGGDIPFVKPGDLDKEKFIYYTEEDSLTDEGFKNAPFLPKYSVLVSCIGNLGKKAILGVDGSCNQQINVILPNEYVDYKYLYYYIDKIIPWMEQNASATTVTILNKGKFEQAPFLLPPLNEQKRIVEKIEEEFGKIDEGVEKLKLVQEQLKQYRQSVLKSAFDGKLYKTTEWESDKLGNIFETSSGGTPKRGNTSYYGGNIPWLKSGELNNGIVSSADEFITEEGLKNSSAKVFPKGSLLIALYGATVGKLGILDFDSATNQAICCIYQNENYNKNFLFYYLLFKKEYLVNQGKGGAQPNISQEIVKALIVPIPTLDEQKQIVKEIEKRFEVADEVERVIAENLEKAEQLKQSILKKAFEGRLVPQDPTDEPASILLQKIKSERDK